jgi:hypothetical protein
MSTTLLPYENSSGSVPHLSHLRVFGSRCFYHVPKQLRNKLQPRSKEGTFAGYDVLSRCYRIIPKEDPTSIILSRDVIFDEKSIVSKYISSQSEPMVQKFTNDILCSTPTQLPAVPLINTVQHILPPAQQQQQQQQPPLRRSSRTPEFQDNFLGISMGTILQFQTARSRIHGNVRGDGTLAFCYKSVVEFDEKEPTTVSQALSSSESRILEGSNQL